MKSKSIPRITTPTKRTQKALQNTQFKINTACLDFIISECGGMSPDHPAFNRMLDAQHELNRCLAGLSRARGVL